MILRLFSPPFLPILLWRDGRWGGKDGMIPPPFLFSVSSPNSSLVQWEMGRKRWGDSPPFLSPLPHSSPVDIYSPPPSSPLFPRIRTINSSLAVGEGEGACNLKVKWPITACNFCNRRSFFLANLQVSGVVGTPSYSLPLPPFPGLFCFPRVHSRGREAGREDRGEREEWIEEVKERKH